MAEAAPRGPQFDASLRDGLLLWVRSLGGQGQSPLDPLSQTQLPQVWFLNFLGSKVFRSLELNPSNLVSELTG
jgi:hypothetical protein